MKKNLKKLENKNPKYERNEGEIIFLENYSNKKFLNLNKNFIYEKSKYFFEENKNQVEEKINKSKNLPIDNQEIFSQSSGLKNYNNKISEDLNLCPSIKNSNNMQNSFKIYSESFNLNKKSGEVQNLRNLNTKNFSIKKNESEKKKNFKNYYSDRSENINIQIESKFINSIKYAKNPELDVKISNQNLFNF